MIDSTYQLNMQLEQEFRKFHPKNEISQLHMSTLKVEKELRDKENAHTLLKRQSSLKVKNTPTTHSRISRQKSFCQTTPTPQRKISRSLQDIEFSIINLESQNIGLECEISTLKQKYSNIEITQAAQKKFAGQFMKLWREVEEVEKRFTQLFNELPSTHEYNSHGNQIKTWILMLRNQLWTQREEIVLNHQLYQMKLKKKEEEQENMIYEYFRLSGMRHEGVWEDQFRHSSKSPVESEFGSGMSSISSMSSVSSDSQYC